jgi:hypothetical protein
VWNETGFAWEIVSPSAVSLLPWDTIGPRMGFDFDQYAIRGDRDSAERQPGKDFERERTGQNREDPDE